ncbi:MAG: helix-turn-helix domain-containing protein [Parafannyhessea sp.]|uniref:helix-turn-helix domain-containing protein n=1 Tax=Parafannyhessea sp. TaxID=2847324 RepID=UPI003F0204A8
MRGNMRAERARRGLSEREVAKEIGVNANQVSRWEQGSQEPSGSNLLKLAAFYGCSPDYLLDLTLERKKQVVARGE